MRSANKHFSSGLEFIPWRLRWSFEKGAKGKQSWLTRLHSLCPVFLVVVFSHFPLLLRYTKARVAIMVLLEGARWCLRRKGSTGTIVGALQKACTSWLGVSKLWCALGRCECQNVGFVNTPHLSSWRNLPILTLTSGGKSICVGWITKSHGWWISSGALTRTRMGR